MATGVVTWSQTAATNATADSNVNWAEGMAPSQVNDSARAVMASVAKWRDDLAGTLVSSGSNTAYTVSSNQLFSSLTALNGQTLTVRFNAANGAAPTLSVDSLGAKPIQVDSVTAVAIGALAANSVHQLVYDNSLGVFIVHQGAKNTLTELFSGVNTQSGATYTIGATDFIVLLNDGTVTLTLPAASSSQGRWLLILGVGTTSIISSASSNISHVVYNGVDTHIVGQEFKTGVLLVSDGTNWVIVLGY